MQTTYQLLAKQGFCAVPALFNSEVIEEWNTKLDSVIYKSDSERKYVDCEQLNELGLLTEVFNENLRGLINHLMPNAVLHHCHVYEIPGGQKNSHIHAENGRAGWHRDEECLSDSVLGHPNFVSIFVYLTDVANNSGPFEISDYPPQKLFDKLHNRKSHKMVGKAGYSFLFDRTFMHRASPNASENPRRVLKLSIQPPQFENTRIHLDEFKNVLGKLDGQDPMLIQLFGGKQNPITENRGEVGIDEKYGTPIELEYNSHIHVSVKTDVVHFGKRVARTLLGRRA